MNENFIQAFEALGMDAGHAKELALNGFRASFMEEGAKRAALDKVEEYFEDFQ